MGVNYPLRRQAQLGPKGRAWRRGPAQTAATARSSSPAKKEAPPDAGPVEPSSQKDGRCRALLNKSGGGKLGGSRGRSQADTLMGPCCAVQFLLRLFEGQRVGVQIDPSRTVPVGREIEGHENLSRSKMLGMGWLPPPLRSGMNQKQSGVQASMRAFFSASIFHAF